MNLMNILWSPVKVQESCKILVTPRKTSTQVSQSVGYTEMLVSNSFWALTFCQIRLDLSLKVLNV